MVRPMSCLVDTRGHTLIELEDFECFSSKLWKGGFIKVNDESQQPIQAIGSESLF